MAVPAWNTASAGGWADDVEQEEAKNGGKLVLNDDFPTLGAASKVEPTKKKKAVKGQKMNLGAFLTTATRNQGLSDQDLRASLPTKALGRQEGDSAGGMGGAFKDYGNQRGGFDDDNGRRDRDDEYQPSRADAADDWGKDRAFTASEGGGSRGGGGFGGGGFRDREGGFQDREGGYGDRRGEEDGPSRADESSSWGTGAKFVPGGAGGDRDRRPGGFEDRGPRSGFGEDRERQGGFGGERRGYDEPSRADEGDWGARRALSPPRDGGSRGTKNYGFAGDRGGDEGVDRWAGRPGGPSDGSSGLSERPRLKLAPRTKPIEPIVVSAEAVPEAAQAASAANGDEEAPAPRKKSNPFGSARPREEVLKEKGVDPVKQELKLEHHADLRDDTTEEVALKKEIEDLRLQVEVLKAADGAESEEAGKLVKEADDKEMHLLRLTAELDDAVKYAKRKPAASASQSPATAPAPTTAAPGADAPAADAPAPDAAAADAAAPDAEVGAADAGPEAAVAPAVEAGADVVANGDGAKAPADDAKPSGKW